VGDCPFQLRAFVVLSVAIWYFFLVVYFTTLSVFDYMASNDRWLMNNALENVLKKQLWHDQGTIPVFSWRD
jgi:hypothetical protein